MKKNVEQDAQYASSRDADATREKLAEIYASALLGAAENANASVSALWEEYDSFVEQVCDAYPKFDDILDSAAVPTDEKYRMIDSLCRDASQIFRNFLKTLVRRGRFGFIREIRAACRRLSEERLGHKIVSIKVANPLDDDMKAKLAARLKTLIGGEPIFDVVVDPNVIGGIVLRVGDVVYDASIATQINKALQDMINRSAHEIQSRRDCFSNSERN